MEGRDTGQPSRPAVDLEILPAWGAVVTLRGEHDLSTVAELDNALARALQQARVLVDLSSLRIHRFHDHQVAARGLCAAARLGRSVRARDPARGASSRAPRATDPPARGHAHPLVTRGRYRAYSGGVNQPGGAAREGRRGRPAPLRIGLPGARQKRAPPRSRVIARAASRTCTTRSGRGSRFAYSRSTAPATPIAPVASLRRSKIGAAIDASPMMASSRSSRRPVSEPRRARVRGRRAS